MSLHLEFESHSCYMGAAIRKQRLCLNKKVFTTWDAYILNGMTGYIVELHATSLAQIRRFIKEYVTSENERIERLYRGL